MGVAILPHPPVSWDYYVAGPCTNDTIIQTDAGGARASQCSPAYSPNLDNSATPRDQWKYSQGGTGAINARDRFNDIIAWYLSTTNVASIQALNNCRHIPMIDRTLLAPGYINPSFMRVQWTSFNLALDAGSALDGNSGVIMSATGGLQSTPFWPSTLGAGTLWNSGQGIVGDGAGNWNWESYGPAPIPATVLESISLAPFIADPTLFHTFDFVTIAASGDRPAVYQLLIDGVVRVERNWEDAIALTIPGGGATGYNTQWAVGTTTGDRIYMSSWEFKMGRFRPDGREVTK